jgi:hypothetical protein
VSLKSANGDHLVKIDESRKEYLKSIYRKPLGQSWAIRSLGSAKRNEKKL